VLNELIIANYLLILLPIKNCYNQGVRRL